MRIPKRMVGKIGEASHQRSRRQEKELASRFRGRMTRGSGRGNEKGDVRVRGLLRIEAKTTKHKSFSVTREMVDKIENAAITTGELPALIVEFNDGGAKVSELAVIPVWALETLIEKVMEERNE